MHAQEGYALDWSPVTQGLLGAGDCSGSISLLEPDSAGRWAPSEPLRVSHSNPCSPACIIVLQVQAGGRSMFPDAKSLSAC